MKEFILFVTILAFQNAIYAAPPTPTASILESFEDKIESHKKAFEKLLKTSEKRQVFVSNLDPKTQLTIDPLFIQSILLNSKPQYLSLLKNSPCTLYSLLENDLLKTIAGKVREIVVLYNPTPETTKKIQISKDELIRHVYKSTCFKNKDISTLFNLKNQKKTISRLKLDVPNDEKQCHEIHSQWIKNPYLPFLCKVPETLLAANHAHRLLEGKAKLSPLQQDNFRRLINRAQQLKASYSFFTRTYLHNLCENIDNVESFCSLYTADDTWRKVTNGEMPNYLISFKCKNLMRKDALSPKDLEQCRDMLLKDPNLCQMKGSGKLPSLRPRPDCNEISTALGSANLVTNYHDCPGNIDNEGITNTHRVVMHLTDRKIRSTTDTCATEANYSFAKINIDYDNKKAWPLKVCYKDPGLEERKCKNFIPGHHAQSELSETRIVSEILQRIINAPNSLKCRFVDKSSFNPALLEFKNGCFIVYDINNCTTLKCDKEIYYRNKIVKGLEYEGIPLFDYFPNSYKNEKFSIIEILKKTYKIQSKPLRNLTEITFHLQKKKQIIHGVGCAEDLLPTFYKKKTFNQCSPLPFISDAVVKVGDLTYLSTRTAIDDLHSPRLIPWTYIFSAVRTYQELQPINQWTLHGIK